jgi:hypothetical protein
MLPQAYVAHVSTDRLRLRVPSKRGDQDYFDRVRELLLREGQFPPATTNPTTGSILFDHPDVRIDELKRFTAGHKLFALKELPDSAGTLIGDATTPVATIDKEIREISSGYVDTASLLFMALVGFAIAEMVRGNWRTPPWYVALWYAFDLVNKSITKPTQPPAKP